MSRIRANKITDKAGTGAIEIEKGAWFPVGYGLTGAGSVNITGVVTANSFSGDGSGLIGVASTDNIVTGTAATFNTYPVDINAGMTVAGVSSLSALTATTGGFTGGVSGTTGTFSGAVSGTTGTFSGSVSIGGTLTYEDVTNIDSVGLITARTGIRLADDKKIILGTGGDFEIYHDTSSRSGVRFTNPEFRLMAAHASTGNIQFGVSNSSTELSYSSLMAEFKKGAECYLTYNSSQKIATSNTGISVYGTVVARGADIDDFISVGNNIHLGNAGIITATSFSGDGSNLTNLSVGITTEQVNPSSNVATLNLAKDDHKIVASGTYTIDVSGGTEAGAHTLRIENSGTANVGFSTYFKFPSGGTPSLPTASGAISLISFSVHKVGSVGIATVLLSGASVNYS